MKRHLSITILLTMLMSMVGAKAFAYDVAAVNDDGVVIYYYLSWNSNQQAYELSVTSYDKLGSTNKYAGYVAIPESAVYQGKACPVTSIGDMAFLSCSDLFAVDIPNTVKSIGNAAFQYCDGLTSVTIPGSVTSIGYSAFDNCRNMTSVTIHSGVKSINGSAFRYCISLTSVTIPSSVTSIGGAAFSFCTGMTSIDVEAGNTKYDSRNNCNAIIETSSNTLIAGCKNTVIPDGVASIGVDAFYGCSGLTSAIIPSSVTSIGDRAFLNCSNLKTIVSEITEPFEIGEIAATSVVLIVPAGTRTAYQSTAGWSSFTNILEVGEGGAVGNTFEKDGIFYTIGENNTASVTSAKTDLSGALVIPSEVELNGKKYDVTSIKGWAFYSSSGVTSVTIPSSVISIGEYAFSYGGLTSIKVEAGNAKYDSRNNCNAIIETSSNTLFAGCKNTVIPNSVTSIGDMAFLSCNGLTSITIPNSVTSIGKYAFAYCKGLTTFTIPSSVTSIGNGVFLYSSGLKKIVSEITEPFEIGDIGTTSVILVVPDGTKAAYQSTAGWSSFTNIYEASDVIVGNTYLINDVSYTIGENNTASVTSSNKDISGAVVIPSQLELKGEKYDVISIGKEAFYFRQSLTSVTIPNSVTSIGKSAFYGCSGLTSITIPSSVTSIEDFAFRTCSGLASIIVETGNAKYDSRDNCNAIIETSSNTLIAGCKNTVIPSSVTSIGDGAFIYCSGLTSVSFPTSVTKIGEIAFYGCTGLSSVTIPNSVISIGTQAFSYCSGLTSIVVETGNANYDSRDNCNAIINTSSNTLMAGCKNTVIPNSVTSLGRGAFLYCSGLTSVTIPNSVTSIGMEAFSSCSNLTSVTIGNSVESIGYYAFYGCSGLTSVTIPNSVTSISNGAFQYCSGLKTIVSEITEPFEIGNIGTTSVILIVPDGTKAAYQSTAGWSSFKSIFEVSEGIVGGTIENNGIYYTIGENYTASVTSANKGISSAVILGQVDVNGEKYDVTSISYDAFLECVSLRSVTIPNSVTYIGDGAFQHCRNLTSINIPNSVTYIDRYAFYYCSSLKYLAFGTQLKKIDQEAFSCCPAIVEITSKATTPPSCGDAVFLSVNKKNCKLFVPKGCADAYKAAWQWQDLNIQEDEGGPLGDADNDGIVDNNDIDEIASYIMSRDTNNIRFLNADMNGDNEVNVADLVLLINLCSFNAIETPLTFEAVSGTVTVSVNNYYCSFAPTIQYRVDDGEWTNLTLSHNDCHGSPFYANAIPAGKIVQIRSTGWYTCILAQNDGLDISCDADCYVYGNISSVNSLDYVTIISGTPSFVFYKNTHIKTLPEKALFLGNNCGSNAFFGCTGLTSITIPNNVTSIGEKAFGNCTKLTDVTCLAESVPSTNADAFDGSSIGSATLHVPQSALSNYQNTAPWSGFGKIVAIGGKE